MEIEEISSKENPLLKRKELVIKVVAEAATPKKNELLDKVCTKYNISNKELVVLDSIKTSYGMKESEAYVKIYESEEALKATEPQPKEKKEKTTDSNVPDASGEMKVDLSEPAETPAEEKKEEKPAEEKKEEAPEEEKPAEEKKE
jgi:small subunit ribosomal protein S24e